MRGFQNNNEAPSSQPRSPIRGSFRNGGIPTWTLKNRPPLSDPRNWIPNSKKPLSNKVNRRQSANVGALIISLGFWGFLTIRLV